MEEGKADRPTIGPEEIGKGNAFPTEGLEFEPLGGDRLASLGIGDRRSRRISRQQRGASQRRQQTQKPHESHRGTHLNVFP